MPVNSPRQNFARPSAPTASGQRLYLRDEELDAGLELIFSARDTIRAHTLALVQSMGLGLNWSQARVLQALLRKPQGVQALTHLLGLTKQATIKILEDLTARGLVSRTQDPRDGRRRTLSLTEAGSRLAGEIAGLMRGVLAQAYRQSGGEAVSGCDTVLQAICATPAPVPTTLTSMGEPSR